MPPLFSELFGDDGLLECDVVLVVTDRRRGEVQHRDGLGVASGAENAGGLARDAVQHPRLVEAEKVGGGEDRHVKAKVLDEVGFLAERQAADV